MDGIQLWWFARLPANRHERKARLAFNAQLISYHQSIEWGMRAFQGSFAQLQVPLDIQDNHAVHASSKYASA